MEEYRRWKDFGLPNFHYRNQAVHSLYLRKGPPKYEPNWILKMIGKYVGNCRILQKFMYKVLRIELEVKSKVPNSRYTHRIRVAKKTNLSANNSQATVVIEMKQIALTSWYVSRFNKKSASYNKEKATRFRTSFACSPQV